MENIYVVIYRMIHDERSIYCEVIISVIVKKKSSYEHVFDSEWLPT